MTSTASQIGFLFPGQGAQFVGMGKDLYEQSEKAKAIYDQANEILGYDLKKICFEGPEDELTRTSYAQTAIFVTSIAALTVIKDQFPNLTPSFVAGLSLGEFTALVAGGSFDFETGLKLVQKRAEAMERSAQNNPGTMASIMGLNQDDCEAISKEAGCNVANLNAPDQIVLSGTVPSIEKACGLAEAKGAKRAIRLKVGGAFHSPLMQEAKDDLEKALAETQINEPKCTFIPNAIATKVSEPGRIKELLATQLMSSVRWVETMTRAKEEGAPLFLEVGPGKVLKGLARRCDRELSVEAAGTFSDISKLQTLLVAS